MIEVNNLSCRYKGANYYAIQKASFRIESGGVTAIVGTSGIGKSTLIALLSGIYTARDEVLDHFSGRILIDGKTPDQLSGPRTISWVPQHSALLDHLTVEKNIMLPLTITQADGRCIEDGKERCRELLKKLEMHDDRRDYKDARPRQLSGGMRTRVSIARALVSRPRYLFLDEPFVSLDVKNRWTMYKLLRDERDTEELCTMITTHDIPEAMLLADRILLVDSVADSTTIKVFPNDPIDMHGRGLEDSLTEARLRAQTVERRIYERTLV